ncbi:MAG: FtsX-like permease family protein [Planctomycetes bacterium]|nr:FtsX-like permease family protein [Planctomycetota bacterium]
MTTERLMGEDRGAQRKIQRQRTLPLSKAVEIAWKSLMVRFWRSMITMSGIILAIGFLMSIWTSTALVDKLRGLDDENEDKGIVDLILQRQGVEMAAEEARLCVLSPKAAGGIAQADFAQLLKGRKDFRLVAPPDPERLADELRNIDCVILCGLSAAFETPNLVEKLDAHVKAGNALVLVGKPQRPTAAGPDAAKAQEALAALLPIEPSDAAATATAKRLKAGLHTATRGVDWQTCPPLTFFKAKPKSGAKVLVSTDAGDPVMVSGSVGKGRVLAYLADDPGFAAHIKWPSGATLIGQSLRWVNAPRLVAASGGSAKNTWLITLSLLVCFVGITNAMLMSVSERVREIGTMKCLGALDRFIIKLFLLESTFQGVCGTVIGIILGFILAYARSIVTYTYYDRPLRQWHFFAIRYFPGTSLIWWAVLALFVGSALSVLAAIFPAYRAAKMQPVDAMRVEE